MNRHPVNTKRKKIFIDRFICFYVDKIAKTRKNIKKRERKETPLEYIRFVYYILLLDDS